MISVYGTYDITNLPLMRLVAGDSGHDQSNEKSLLPEEIFPCTGVAYSSFQLYSIEFFFYYCGKRAARAFILIPAQWSCAAASIPMEEPGILFKRKDNIFNICMETSCYMVEYIYIVG
jgi:hypothetical protein